MRGHLGFGAFEVMNKLLLLLQDGFLETSLSHSLHPPYVPIQQCDWYYIERGICIRVHTYEIVQFDM